MLNVPFVVSGAGGLVSRSGCQASGCKEWDLDTGRVNFPFRPSRKEQSPGNMRSSSGRSIQAFCTGLLTQRTWRWQSRALSCQVCRLHHIAMTYKHNRLYTSSRTSTEPDGKASPRAPTLAAGEMNQQDSPSLVWQMGSYFISANNILGLRVQLMAENSPVCTRTLVWFLYYK